MTEMLYPSFSGKLACIYHNYLNTAVENQNVLRMDKRMGEVAEKYILQCPPKAYK